MIFPRSISRHGTLLQDLVNILLCIEPSRRPSAKQILHIPAMQPYVNKVFERGKAKRSESVGCNEDATNWHTPTAAMEKTQSSCGDYSGTGLCLSSCLNVPAIIGK